MCVCVCVGVESHFSARNVLDLRLESMIVYTQTSMGLRYVPDEAKEQVGNKKKEKRKEKRKEKKREKKRGKTKRSKRPTRYGWSRGGCRMDFEQSKKRMKQSPFFP